MKFAHDFKDTLERGEYPPQWVESAISYRQLKKCIRKVQEELAALGLDTETLNGLWQAVGSDAVGLSENSGDRQSEQFRYTFAGE